MDKKEMASINRDFLQNFMGKDFLLRILSKCDNFM